MADTRAWMAGVDGFLSLPCVDPGRSPGRSRADRREDRDPEAVQGGDIDDLGYTDLCHQRLNGSIRLLGRPGTVCSVEVLFLYRTNRDCHPGYLGGDTLIV